MNQAIALVAAYLLGSIPFAYLAGRLHGVDLRSVGSGNLGATNVFRTLGRTVGIVVMVLDIAKGALAVVVARGVTDAQAPTVVAGVTSIIGHIYPVGLGGRGGKGGATAAGGGGVRAPVAGAVATYARQSCSSGATTAASRMPRIQVAAVPKTAPRKVLIPGSTRG